ncbi:MAG: hypothetical protein M3209_14815 [Acidobacteriota bacterium]|nr:hypothetical protein [Acidobacteriota bacterium]
MSENRTSQILQICAACGAKAQRLNSKFCAICGKIMNQDYAPLDSLWASYNLQSRKESQKVVKPKQEIKELFEKPRNNAAATAMAFVVYSLVPYLGILFCPGAILMGGIGLAVSYQKPQLGGRQAATYSICLGAIITAIQVLLWWLLYLIPELKRF